MSGPERALKLASHGDWGGAYDLFAEADCVEPLRGEPLTAFAQVAYAAGHLDQAIELWERAHASAVEAGDRAAAAGAAVRVALHLLIDTGLMAPVRGWIQRAERLLEGLPETPVHAWLAVVRNYERMLTGDFSTARGWAQRAIELGAVHDPAAAAIGRVAEARSLILEGDVREGLQRLEQAGVAAVSGELDPLSTGIVYCELVCALQAAAQYDQAEQWTEAMERWCPGHAIGSIRGRCRVHRAEILRLRGAHAEAEREVLAACEELRPYLRRELGWPLTELGRIRLRTGDLDGAEEAFLQAHELGWDQEPGLALVRLADGDAADAAALIRYALERPADAPSKELPPNTELRRAPLLAAQVEIEIAAGRVEDARAAAAELERLSVRFESKALQAAAALAHGRVALAAGNAREARRCFAAAAAQWTEIGAPYEAALARLGLAEAHRLEGHSAAAAIEQRSAEATLERIGAKPLVPRATSADPPPAPAGPVPEAAPRHALRREGETWCVVFEGEPVRLRDGKGLRVLARLLAEPGRELHVLDLVASGSGPAPSARGDAGSLLDEQSKAAYRRRLAEIEQDIAEATERNDVERLGRSERERDFLARELSRAIGLGGRDRRAGSASERARVSVTRAVRQTIARIRAHDPHLAAHLDHAVRTGTVCAYVPDPRAPVAWTVSV